MGFLNNFRVIPQGVLRIRQGRTKLIRRSQRLRLAKHEIENTKDGDEILQNKVYQVSERSQFQKNASIDA
jgi:hypothetical protein